MRGLKIRVVAVLIGALLTIIVGSQVYNALKLQRQSAYWSVQEAFAQVPAHPALARTVLRHYNGAEAKIALAIDLFYFLPRTKANFHETQVALSEAQPYEINWPKLVEFDGSENSLITLVQRSFGAKGPLIIPCQVVAKVPDLVRTTIYYGSGNDMPEVTCADTRYTLPPSVISYDNSFQPINGFNNTCGTIASTFFAGDFSAKEFVEYAPSLLSSQFRGKLPDQSVRPLRQWSYLSLWNYATYQSIGRKFTAARRDLRRYYIRSFGMSRVEAAHAAQRAVWVLDDTGWWASDQSGSNAAPGKLVVAIMDHHPVAEVSALLKTQTAPASDLLLTVDNPEALKLLLAQKPDVETANSFGKTALMEAAMQNQLRSIRLLLAAGAKVNAASLPPKQIPGNEPFSTEGMFCGGDYHITHGSRTALMYAAANAGLPVIQTLLKAGADKNAKDSKGADALDYLVGKGPVPRNPVLSAKDFSIAMSLLKP